MSRDVFVSYLYCGFCKGVTDLLVEPSHNKNMWVTRPMCPDCAGWLEWRSRVIDGVRGCLFICDECEEP